jgi:membrane-bound inhibitor of C-type lysozyme
VDAQAKMGEAAILLTLALALGACRDPATGARAPATPPRAAEGSVNPGVSVVVYACADGQAITAGYPDRETAVVTYKDHAYTLRLARSASGARYIGYGLQWWTKGAHASMAALKPGEDTAAPGLDCTAEPNPALVEPVVRTAFGSEALQLGRDGARITPGSSDRSATDDDVEARMVSARKHRPCQASA